MPGSGPIEAGPAGSAACHTSYSCRMTMLSFRVDEAEAAEVQAWAQRLGVGRSEFLRTALHRYLVRLKSEADTSAWAQSPPTDAEQSLAHAADWGPAEDWSDWE
jgi:antitoxin MazE2